ncbi:MFS transporter [Homoserinibacter sp. YIM 151385]|uniref:MFS transporter n=1 Tax=Homoserinibacter sp. YIM 151385 TaxID=2985506 RepID=UPI0022F10D09|nr:MFS transporter [Homoserinibacter sp. YIM 151385]WBU37488.1 MFS transporter [Homoserinibacter sp. YIM 151385]
MVAASTLLIAATYGLVRLASGLHAPEMRAELGLDASAVGLVAGGGSLVYCLGAATGARLAPRHPRIVVAGAGLTAATGAAGMAAAAGSDALAAAAILSSAGAGLASPAVVRLLQQRDAGPAAQAIANSGTGPGLVAAGALALVLLPDWRAAWWVSAAVAVLAAALLLAADAVLVPVPRGGGGSARTARTGPPLGHVHLPLLMGAVLLGAGSAAVWTFGRSLLLGAGADPGGAAGAWIAIGVGGGLVLATSRALARHPARRSWMLASGLAAAASLALALAPAALPVAIAACAVFGWGYTTATGALIAWTAELDPARAAGGTALLFILLVAGQAAGAAVLGLVIEEQGLAIAVAAGAAAIAVGAAIGLGGAGARTRSAVGAMSPAD